MKKLLFMLSGILLISCTSMIPLENKVYATNNGGLILNEWMVEGIGVAGAKEWANNEDDLIKVIKNGINRVLGILSLITLILLLWGGFQMVTANGDDKKAKAGLTILKQAAIGLGFIAVSRFIVSIIFRVITNTTKVTP